MRPKMSEAAAGPRRGVFEVTVLSRLRSRRVGAPRIERVLRRAARALGLSGSVTVLLVGDRGIRSLNRRYRRRDRPTDVLSFAGPGGEMGLGDIGISVETAAKNPEALPVREEVDLLALHGLLHLLGHDHETDGGEMERVEQRLRARLGLGRVGRRAAGRRR
jgi:probable rRNA maturation factor